MNQAAMIQAVGTRLKIDVLPKNPSDCMIRCYLLPKGGERQQCVTDCEAEAAVAALAEKLHIELFKSFAEVIWAGGNIDPVPLEGAVRAKFAHMKQGGK